MSQLDCLFFKSLKQFIEQTNPFSYTASGLDSVLLRKNTSDQKKKKKRLRLDQVIKLVSNFLLLLLKMIQTPLEIYLQHTCNAQKTII